MFDFSLIVLPVSFVIFLFGAYLATKKPASNGRAVSWKSIKAIPMGMPFEIICRPSKLPDHALIRFFNSQEVLFTDLPQPEPLMEFTPGRVVSKMERYGKPVLQAIQRNNLPIKDIE